MTKRKWLRAGALFLMLCTLLTIPVGAQLKVYHWFFKKNEEQKPPAIDREFWFINQYDAFAIDSTAKDDDKVIYLTFDAGYENGNVEKVVDALDAHGAKGAFFVLSHFLKTNSALAQRMAASGHLLCNHTATHRNITELNAEALATDLAALEAEGQSAGVTIAKFFRPPEGTFCERNLQDLKARGYCTVFWSFAYCDWDNNNQPSEESALKNVLEHTHNGAVILLHPTSATNAAIMDRLLTAWEAAGYRFGTLEELQSRMVAERIRKENLPDDYVRGHE